MTKTTETTYFAPVSFGAGGCWGGGKTPEAARDRACREARDFAKAFGGFKRGATLTINVYRIRPGCYAHMDERGVFEVDYDTDEIVAYAKVAHRWEDVPPAKPANGTEVDAIDACYSDGGASIDSLNRERGGLIGTKVA